MLTLFVSVEAKPGKKVAFEPDRTIEGYYQTFGVTAKSESELRDLIRDYLAADLQSHLVEICETWPPDWDGTDRDIREKFRDSASANVGIWYTSGRAWFGPVAELGETDN